MLYNGSEENGKVRSACEEDEGTMKMETSNSDLYRETETDMLCIYKCTTVRVQ